MTYFKLKNVAGIMVAVSAAHPKSEAVPVVKAAALPDPGHDSGPSAALREFLELCYKRNAHAVEAMVRKIKYPEELMLAHDHEKAHPKYAPDGRIGILNVIEECFGELSVDSPALPQDL